MRLIIAGSRGIRGVRALFHLTEVCIHRLPFPITEVVSGCADGVDRMGEAFAKNRGIPIKRFPAAWYGADGTFRRDAGFVRNIEMADYADALLAVWDGHSRGTAHMIKQMQGRSKPVVVELYLGDGLDC